MLIVIPFTQEFRKFRSECKLGSVSATLSCVVCFRERSAGSFPEQRLVIGPTIPDKKVETASKLSPPSTYNVDNRVIFFSFCWKKRDIFQWKQQTRLRYQLVSPSGQSERNLLSGISAYHLHQPLTNHVGFAIQRFNNVSFVIVVQHWFSLFLFPRLLFPVKHVKNELKLNARSSEEQNMYDRKMSSFARPAKHHYGRCNCLTKG